MKTSKIQSLIHPQAEQILRQHILKDLENNGRKEYDKPHTEAVVFWMKSLATDLQLPPSTSQVLITAAYAHDWGYSKIQSMQQSRDFDTIIASKKLHMQFGAELIESLLYSKLNKYYTESQKLQVIHLVAIHDKVRELKTENELLLMEADTLGMLDKERVSSTLSRKDTATFLQTSIYNLRLPRFVHMQAKSAAERLLDVYLS